MNRFPPARPQHTSSPSGGGSICAGAISVRTFTLGTVSRSEAEELASQKRDELQAEVERVKDGLPIRTPFSELLRLFERDVLPGLSPNTRRAYLGSLDQYRAYFVKRLEDPEVEKIRPVHVQGFLSWRRDNVRQGGRDAPQRTASARTLQKDRTVLHSVFDYADRMELRAGNPVAKVKAPKVDPRDPVILTDDQFEALLRECQPNPMLHLYAVVLSETGGRCDSEVLWLQWEDVDLEEGFLWIASGRSGRRTKSGKGRHVPMTPRLRAAMRDHFAAYRLMTYSSGRSPWVFHHLCARRHAVAGDRIGSLRRAFNGAAKRAGLPEGLHQHDMRHRRVTTWLAAGKDVVHVKEAVGHSDLRTTMGYTHLAKEHLRSLVEEEPRERLRELGS